MPQFRFTEQVRDISDIQAEAFGKIKWMSPSNIAFIKYWGKHGEQLPRNASFSMTLRESYTITSMNYWITDKHRGEIKFKVNGRENPKFGKRVIDYLHAINQFYPFLSSLNIEIDTINSFPHSAGIASSASAMSSIALCLCSIESELFAIQYSKAEFLNKASFLSRLGSGSACRSIYGYYAVWGKSPVIKASSDLFAVPYLAEINEIYQDLRDAILIIDSGEKRVSSSLGHKLMNEHPFADKRFLTAGNNLQMLVKSMINGDFDKFSEIVENEALMLHGLMMSSNPAYILMKPGTIEIINKIIEFRRDTGSKLCFTLDAGPNIHLIYPGSESDKIESFISRELLQFCENSRVIHDCIGEGPLRLY
jgi:diphosphomevalonate decarboxylase